MTEAPQKATVDDTVSQISRALNAGARMILEQPFGSDYIPNKYALDAWNRRADLPAAVTVKPLEWEKRHTWEIAKCFGDMHYCVVKVHHCNGAINWRLQRNSTVIAGRMVSSFEEAKAAAQADYESRILSCHTTQAAPVKGDARNIRDLFQNTIRTLAELEAERDEMKASEKTKGQEQ